MKKKYFLLVYLLCGFCLISAAQKPLISAFAHNDYAHQRPLLDALDLGFTAVEADIHLIDGRLLVAHNIPSPNSTKTLKELYLKPLQERMQIYQGKIYPNWEGTFYLMIDFKTEAIITWQALRQELLNYPEFHQNPYFKIFISGNRPFESILQDTLAWIALDGRPEELGKGFSAEKMPVVSDRFAKISKWNGKGTIPQTEFKKLQQLANRTHAEGKLLRLWAIPDNENAWKVLLKAGIDFLNTDKLKALHYYLKTLE